MYQDLKQKYWWYGLKRDVAAHVAKCDVCQRVKAEHQRPAGLLHPLKIPEWKWEEIGMDFIVGLPRTLVVSHPPPPPGEEQVVQEEPQGEEFDLI
jgi:hypothetical protein